MTTQKQFYVYLHLRPTNDGVNSVFYVGKGNKRRCSLSFERNNHHKNIVKKYGKENIIIRKFPCKSEQHAFDLEIQMIAKLRQMGVRLANLTDGGEGSSGVIPSCETRMKISLLHKGRIKSNLEKENISKAQKIRFSDPLERKRISDLKKGKKHSIDSRKKMSKSRIGKVMPESTRLAIKKANVGSKRTQDAKRKMSEWQIGRVMSSEARKKMSDAKKGKKQSDETRKKRSESMIGRAISQETKEKIAISNTGKKRSNESKKRMSDAAKSRPPISEETRKKMSESHKRRQAAKRLESKEKYNDTP